MPYDTNKKYDATKEQRRKHGQDCCRFINDRERYRHLLTVVLTENLGLSEVTANAAIELARVCKFDDALELINERRGVTVDDMKAVFQKEWND